MSEEFDPAIVDRLQEADLDNGLVDTGFDVFDRCANANANDDRFVSEDEWQEKFESRIGDLDRLRPHERGRAFLLSLGVLKRLGYDRGFPHHGIGLMCLHMARHLAGPHMVMEPVVARLACGPYGFWLTSENFDIRLDNVFRAMAAGKRYGDADEYAAALQALSEMDFANASATPFWDMVPVVEQAEKQLGRDPQAHAYMKYYKAVWEPILRHLHEIHDNVDPLIANHLARYTAANPDWMYGGLSSDVEDLPEERRQRVLRDFLRINRYFSQHQDLCRLLARAYRDNRLNATRRIDLFLKAVESAARRIAASGVHVPRGEEAEFLRELGVSLAGEPFPFPDFGFLRVDEVVDEIHRALPEGDPEIATVLEENPVLLPLYKRYVGWSDEQRKSYHEAYLARLTDHFRATFPTEISRGTYLETGRHEGLFAGRSGRADPVFFSQVEYAGPDELRSRPILAVGLITDLYDGLRAGADIGAHVAPARAFAAYLVDFDIQKNRERIRLETGGADMDDEELDANIEMFEIVRKAVPWHVRYLENLLDFTAEEREALFRFEERAAEGADQSKPSKKWLADIGPVAQAFDTDLFTRRLRTYDPHCGFIPSEMADAEQEVMKGFVWAAAFQPAAAVAQPLADLAKRSYRALPERGIAGEKIGNACVLVLEGLPDGLGAPLLADIAGKVTQAKVKKRLNEALDRAAAKAGLDRAGLDEMLVPDHGFGTDGTKQVEIGDHLAILEPGDGFKVTVRWQAPGGKTLKSPPKALRESSADEVKAVRDLAKEAQADFRAQSERIERTFLSGEDSDHAHWREHYAEHGTVGPVARRLVWKASDGSGAVTVLPTAGGCEDMSGEAVDCTGRRMSLWHPVEADAGEVSGWRDRLWALGIVQPFRQAWRETYRVTDAERETGHYSNRFAGHILRQHQMMALAGARGWRAVHRVSADVENDEPMYIAVPEHGVYAELWTDVDEEGETASSGAYVHVDTDRVAFHSLLEGDGTLSGKAKRGAPLAVGDVPPVVFSEIMRHCDLFVSVASIALVPDWMDRGADADHPGAFGSRSRAYWTQANNAELGEFAIVRRGVLEQIIPALDGGRGVFELDGNFLRVKGKLREYRIHIGWAGVFREPDSQHVCIVRATEKPPSALSVPVESDETLGLILSKALMLAEDDRIEDPVIAGQIR